MESITNPYIKRNPGDLVSAEDWNDVQNLIRVDIGKQIKDAIAKLNSVPNSENSQKLENKSADQLTKEILEKARQEIPARTGYQRLFKILKIDEQKIIKHGLAADPLVDVYALDTFKVVCSEDEQKAVEEVTFYLYHSSERKLKAPPDSPPGTPSVEIEPTGGTPFRIAFADLLSLYKVEYTNSSTLDDLETEFWQAFLKDPNDDFDDDDYCHSPWFDRCCGDRRTVGDLKSRGDWDELWFKMKPRKTINFTGTADHTVVPPNIEVVHFDFNTIGMTYLTGGAFVRRENVEVVVEQPDKLRVMVLLKV